MTIWILANLSIYSEESHTYICSHPSVVDQIAEFLVVDNYAFPTAAFFFYALVWKKVPEPQIFNSLYLHSLECITQLADGDIFRSTRSLTKTHAHPLDDLFKSLRKIDIPYSALVNLEESNFFNICSHFLSDPLFLNCSDSILLFIMKLTFYPEKDPRIPIVLRTFQSASLVATILHFANSIIDSNQIELLSETFRRCINIFQNLVCDSTDLSIKILDSNILTNILSVIELLPMDTLTELVFLLSNLSKSTLEVVQSAIKFNIPRFVVAFIQHMTDHSAIGMSLSVLTKFLRKDRSGLVIQQIKDLNLIPSIQKLKQREQVFQLKAQGLELGRRSEITQDAVMTPPLEIEDDSDIDHDDALDQVSPGRFSSLQNDDEQSEVQDQPESQNKTSLRHSRRSHAGCDHSFDVSSSPMNNNDQLTQIITDVQGKDLNKISQALETLYNCSRETYQLFVTLNEIDVLIQILKSKPPLSAINKVLTIINEIAAHNDTSPETILFGGFMDFVPQYLSLNDDNISNSTIWILANLSVHSEDTRVHICSHPSLLDLIAQFLVVDNYAFPAAAFFFSVIVREKIPEPQIFNSLYLHSLECITQLADGDIFRSTRSLSDNHIHPLDDLFHAFGTIDIPYSALVNLAESNFFNICSSFLSDPLYLNCSSSILHFIVSITFYPEKDPRTPVVLRIFQSTSLVAAILQFVTTIIDSNQIGSFDSSLCHCINIITNLVYESAEMSRDILDSNILSTLHSAIELFTKDTRTELVFILQNLSESTLEVVKSAVKFNIPRFVLAFLNSPTDLSTINPSLSVLTKFLRKDRSGLVIQQIKDLGLNPSIIELKESATKFLLEYQLREHVSRSD
ncbi:hypothetical protein BLNAU_12686 [Blattamonas nauphoetae]|uniref:Uncharacterized protein n=1 Tax=Blattamonas nauphoetae TaxID=2049346 RepID=A0ABQ9XLQ8_9EUKA|nr:hypothetical protein BLNAU_12686 [Blattamonas nauphoetae]